MIATEAARDFIDTGHNIGYSIGNQATICVNSPVGIYVPTVPSDLIEMDESGEKPVSEMDGRWLLLSCVPKFESRIVSDLTRYGIDTFWPRHVVKVRSRNGRGEPCLKKVRRPVFTGYLSANVVRGEVGELQEVAIREWRCQGVSIGVKPIVDQRRFVRELKTIETIFRNCPNAEVAPLLKPGDPCRVFAGPLAGVFGILLNREIGPKFQVLANFMGAVIEMEIDPDVLERWDGPLPTPDRSRQYDPTHPLRSWEMIG